MKLLLSPMKVQALKMSTTQMVTASHISFLPEERPFMMELRKPRWRGAHERGERMGKEQREGGERQGECPRGGRRGDDGWEGGERLIELLDL